MKTLEDLRQKCKEIAEKEHREAVKESIEYWMMNKAIPKHRVWRAVIGNKKCKPVPIHRDFSYRSRREEPYKNSAMVDQLGYVMWPDLEYEEIKRHLESLGFVIGNLSEKLALSVPAPKKGEPLTFAQKCVKIINQQYSLYVEEEKIKAKNVVEDFITELYNTPDDKIRRGNGCTIFEDFVYSKTISKECCRFCNRYLKQNGIIAYYEDSDGRQVYEGVAVMDKNI